MSTKFESLAENPLDGVMVSNSRRISYTDIHIERMIKNNPDGSLTVLIENTQLKRDAFAGNLSGLKMNEAIRIAYTSELANTTGEFITTLSKFEGLVKSIFGKGTTVYLLFFPFGLDEFRRANQSQLPILMDKVILQSDTYKTELGNTAFHDKFIDLKTRYTHAFSLQKQAGGTVSSSISVKAMLWNELKKQLHINMLTLVLNNIDNPSIMLSYFEPKLLRFRHKKDNGENTSSHTLTIAPNTTLAADISFSVKDTLVIINNGNVPIYYYGATTTNEAPKTAPIELPAGEETEVTASSLGAPSNKFVLLMNKHANESAEVEIALI